MKEIEFTKAFTSPVYGNVYISKKVKVKKSEADRLIESGYAKELKAKKKKEEDKE